MGASLIGACSNSDVSAQLEAVESLGADFDLTQTTGPSEVVSKTLHYVTASGLMDGDQEGVVRSVEERLTAAGWSVVLVESMDVSGSPASEGSRVVANKDGLAVQVAVFDQVGLNLHPSDFARYKCPWLDPAIPSSGRLSTDRLRHRCDGIRGRSLVEVQDHDELRSKPR